MLKNFLKTDYRGVVQTVEGLSFPVRKHRTEKSSALHHAANAAKRLLVCKVAQRLLDETVKRQMGRRSVVPESAIDSTGLGATCASAYFVNRRSRKESPWKTMIYHRYPKLGVVSDVTNHFILAFQSGREPRPDVNEFEGLIAQASTRVRMKRIIADAGYDCESNHVFAREQLSLRTIIPARHGRPTSKPASGRYQRLMQTRFDDVNYRKRAQVETVMSMIKRRQGSSCREEELTGADVVSCTSWRSLTTS